MLKYNARESVMDRMFQDALTQISSEEDSDDESENYLEEISKQMENENFFKSKLAEELLKLFETFINLKNRYEQK